MANGNRTRIESTTNSSVNRYTMATMERVAGIEPAYPGWKPDVLAIVLYSHLFIDGINPSKPTDISYHIHCKDSVTLVPSEGLEPPTTGPKPVVISISPRGQDSFGRGERTRTFDLAVPNRAH